MNRDKDFPLPSSEQIQAREETTIQRQDAETTKPNARRPYSGHGGNAEIRMRFDCFEGRIRGLNLRQRNQFFLFPTLQRRHRIECEFEQELLSKIKLLQGLRIAVIGMCYFNPNDKYPRRIEVFDVEAAKRTQR